MFSTGLRYPLSFYLLVILCLVAAIASLIPAIKLRLGSLRMQVSDDGPLLGPTRLIIEPDGLVIDRKLVKSKYLWAAFQGVEIQKNAIPVLESSFRRPRYHPMRSGMTSLL